MSRLLDANFIYRNSAETDVRRTFARFGMRIRTPEEQQAAAQAKLREMRVVVPMRVHRATLTTGEGRDVAMTTDTNL